MYTLCNGSLQVRSESDHSKIPWRPTTHLPFPDHCKCITTLKSAKHCFFIIQKAKTNPKSLFTIVDPWKLNCNLFQVCAIVGGTFTVAGIIDSCIFSGRQHSPISMTLQNMVKNPLCTIHCESQFVTSLFSATEIFKKFELGKLNWAEKIRQFSFQPFCARQFVNIAI